MNVKVVIFGVILSLTLTYFDQISTAVIENNESNDFGYDDYFGIKVYRIGRACAMNGGLCVQRNDCKYLAGGPSTCPDANIGVECCYEIDLRPAPCKQLLGHCTKKCPATLIRPQAIDCDADQVCCVLV